MLTCFDMALSRGTYLLPDAASAARSSGPASNSNREKRCMIVAVTLTTDCSVIDLKTK